VSDAGDFIDSSLQREGAWYRAEAAQASLGSELQGSDLRFYGASVGAVRGTVRDALRRHRGLTHDDVTALSSELWSVQVFERRLAAVVLLQSSLGLLTNSDLTRIEGFVRQARLRALVDPLAVEVVGPLIEGLDTLGRVRADSVLDRWVREPDAWLRRAALLSPLRAFGAGAGDWDGFIRRARAVLAEPPEQGRDGAVAREAISRMLTDLATKRPELQFPSADV
jgi:DNA alkylation repair enzyme